MLNSYYNTIIGIEGDTILFNAFSERFIVVKGVDLTAPEIDLCEFADQTPTLKQQLSENGFILEDPEKQVEELRYKISKACCDNSTFILNINPTMDCNFSCWYCYENHVPKSAMSADTIEALKRFIENRLRSEPKPQLMQFGFFGGEPLLEFSNVSRQLIEYASATCKLYNVELSINFTSNGSLITEEITNYLKQFDCSFQITLDGGEEKHNQTRFFKGGGASFQKIVSNIKMLASKGIAVIARINFTGKNIDSTLSIPDEFTDIDESAKRFIRFDVQRVWQDRKNSTDATEEKAKSLRQRFRDLGFTVLINNLKTSADNVCYGDKTSHFMINYNGEVFGCTARDFISKNRIGTLQNDGTIAYDGDINLRRNASKFSKQICQTCRIAPICGGGCKQRSFEDSKSNECTFRYTASMIDDLVLDIFDYQYCSDT